MPIMEWWDLWYRQIPGTAQLVDRMSPGVQRGLRELSYAGQDSPAAELQRSAPRESSLALTTAPHPSPAAESFRILQECVGAPSWNTWSIREHCEARQGSTASSATPSTIDEDPLQQTGSEIPVSVRPEEAPRSKRNEFRA